VVDNPRGIIGRVVELGVTATASPIQQSSQTAKEFFSEGKCLSIKDGIAFFLGVPKGSRRQFSFHVPLSMVLD